jgi:signal transduction histidine kinase
MKLPWPRTIAAQLIAVILLGLAVAISVTLVIFADERREALEVQRRTQIIGRVVSAVQLLAALPPEQHARLLRHTSTPLLQISLDDGPLVPLTDWSRHNRLQLRLTERLNGLARQVLVQRPTGPMLWRPWRERDDDEPARPSGWLGARDDEDGRRRAVPPIHDRLAISVELADGHWLNARGVVPEPPGWPARSAIAIILLMTAGVIAGVILVVRRLTAPLRELATAADRLGRGETVPPIADAGPEEVRRTTRAFNRMQERLKRFVDDRTRMLAAISHDLRTPITTLRLRAEFIDDEETRTKMIETLDELQRMAEATLAFVREEASSEDTRTVDLAALAESVVDDMADVGREASMSPAPRLPYACRPIALKRALRNLVENAIGYGKRARVALARGPEDILLTVEDDGPGIPADEVERVFAPFVRLEPSRNSETGGIGLGLAIARNIARAHGGDITLANRAEGGLRATLRLPLQA